MEKWTHWQPIKEISGKYYVDTFVWSNTWDLIVTLSRFCEQNYLSHISIPTK